MKRAGPRPKSSRGMHREPAWREGLLLWKITSQEAAPISERQDRGAERGRRTEVLYGGRRSLQDQREDAQLSELVAVDELRGRTRVERACFDRQRGTREWCVRERHACA